MSLESLMRFGYVLMLFTLLLMIWSSLARAREIDSVKYAPCTFNPLCTCSKPAPDLGIVQCRNVPFPAVPKTVNLSKVFMLHMENTGLQEIEPYFLQSTGLYRIEISHNPITNIPDDSFIGLERTLWELVLQHNELIDIPSRAIRHLQKLRHLDLSGNKIACIEPESFRGLEDSLQTLILSKNLINTLPPDSFSTLPLLDTIDLSGNNIDHIDPNIFRDGMPRLSKLLLSDNILREIPYIAIAALKQLRYLDLAYNVIKSVQPDDGTTEPKAVVKLTLDTLHLEFNLIETLPTASFQNFDVVNKTFLDGNPLTSLGEQAFRTAKIRELYIRHCELSYVSPLSFDGLGNSLQILDLSGNNITSLPENVFSNFDNFRSLSLKDNKIGKINPVELFNGFQFTLFKLDLSGEKNAVTNLQDLRRMRNMRSLSITKLPSTSLSADDFLEFGLELEDLKITRGSLKTIKSHAFTHIRGVKRLDLSENKISQIEPDAFNEIGHSLISLRISHGLDGSMGSLPANAMHHLTSLQELDISNNQLKTMSDTSFHFLKNLQTLELHDNRIEQVLKGTFQGDIHSNLKTISMSFNNLRLISQHTFVDLQALQRIRLDDNRIEHLERRAFMNLDQLKHLSLRGNKLNSISDEAFQVFKDDLLPQYLCCACEKDVEEFYKKIRRSNKLERKWVNCMESADPSHPFLEVLKVVEQHTHKIQSTIDNLIPNLPAYNKIKHNILCNGGLNNGTDEAVENVQKPLTNHTNDSNTTDEKFTILKRILTNQYHVRVKTLKQICLDYINTNGDDLLESVLRVELPELNADELEGSENEWDDAGAADNGYDDWGDGGNLQTAVYNSQGEEVFENNKIKRKRRNPVRDYVTSRKRGKRRFNFQRKKEVVVENVDMLNATAEKNENLSVVVRSRQKKKLDDIAGKDENSVDTSKSDKSMNTTNENVTFETRRSRRRIEQLENIAELRSKSLEVKKTLPSETTDTIIKRRSATPQQTTAAQLNAPTTALSAPSKHVDGIVIKTEMADGEPVCKRRDKKKYREFIRNITKKKRSKTRINYSEALVDEALMYEEILMDKEAKEQLVIATALENSKNDNFCDTDEMINISVTPDIIIPKTPSNKNDFSFDTLDDVLPIRRRPSSATTSTFTMESTDPNCAAPTNEVKIEKANTSTLKKMLEQKHQEPPKWSSEISITPIKKSAASAVASTNTLNVSMSEIQKTFKTNPETVFNFNSAVSIQLKSPNSSNAVLIKSEPQDFGYETSIANALNNSQGVVRCKFCGKLCPSVKHLAAHSTAHLTVQAHKLGEVQVLSPKLRRGRMVPMGSQKCFRCLNCWRLHPNSQSILEHWVTGKCLFYCSICGESFHQNPKLIREHFPTVHGIKYKLPEDNREAAMNQLLATQNMKRKRMVMPVGMGGNPLPVQRPPGSMGEHPRPPPIMGPQGALRRRGVILPKLLKINPNIQPNGRVKCNICFCSFPNMQSRNSHMRLHKHEKDPNRQIRMRPIAAGPSSATAATLANTPQDKLKHLNQTTLIRLNQNQMHQMRMKQQMQQTQNRQRPPGPHQFQMGNNKMGVFHQQQPQIRKLPPQYHAQRHFQQQQQQRHLEMVRQRQQQQAFTSVKTEIPDESSNDFTEYNNSMDEYQNDYLNDFSSELPLQPEIVMEPQAPTPTVPPPGPIIKLEPRTSSSPLLGGPRLQVKKLHELQEIPSYAAGPSNPTYYSPSPQQSQHIVNNQQLPLVIQQQPHATAAPLPAQQQYQMNQQPQIMLQVPPQMQPQFQISTVQSAQQPQFQISQVQQVQNAQYYNPVFVVQPQQQAAQQQLNQDLYQQQQQQQQHHHQQQYGQMDPQMDYSKYYS